MALMSLLQLFFQSLLMFDFFFFSSRRRHTRFDCDWSSDVCSSDLCGRWNRRRPCRRGRSPETDRKSTRLNSSHSQISYAVFCLKKKKKKRKNNTNKKKKKNKTQHKLKKINK